MKIGGKDRPFKLTVNALMDFDSGAEGNIKSLELADLQSLSMYDIRLLVWLGLKHGANGSWDDLTIEEVGEAMTGNLMNVLKETGEAYVECLGLDLEKKK